MWTQDVFDTIKAPLPGGRWINRLEVLYCSSATVLSLLARRGNQPNELMIRVLEGLHRLVSTEAARTRALSKMNSERWQIHGFPFKTQEALKAIHRDLKSLMFKGLLAPDTHSLVTRAQLGIENIFPAAEGEQKPEGGMWFIQSQPISLLRSSEPEA